MNEEPISPSRKTVLSQPVSVLMPIHNEADVIEKVVEEWVREVFQFLPEGSEFLFDEAESTDGTREILARLSVKYPFISVVQNERKDGFAASARRLYHRAKCPWVFFTDSDGQYVASEFWKLAPYTPNFSVIHGAKISRQDPVYRRLASYSFNKISRAIFDTAHSDINSAFRLMNRAVVVRIVEKCRHMPTLLNAEVLLRAEFESVPIKQVRVRHRGRETGVSRGLPPGSFVSECYKAYRGLFLLRAEYTNRS